MRTQLIASAALAVSFSGMTSVSARQPADDMGLSTLTKLSEIDDRYQSYNVEMVEVTGGRFWAPYGGPTGEVYRERPPINLADPRLIALAKHLGPSLMRVSGTWANNTYLLAEGENLTSPPEGFKQTLTREQWRGVVAFSKAVDAPIVTSFAVSAGTRSPEGVWQTDQAQRLADLTKALGGSIYAAEFFNEPNVPHATVGMPKDYNAQSYATEFRIFKDWANKALPEMKILGPGGVGEGGMLKDIPVNAFGDFIPTEQLAKGNPESLDAFTYHFYGTVSQRCAHMNIGTAVKEDALKPEWLDRTAGEYDFYATLRDKYEKGKPVWNTETAQAACGGSPWASTFLDSFRYLNQNGILAQKGAQVVMHNTLAASDYGLIDQDTLVPRPNYWAAVLWKRIMGQTVLQSPKSPSPDVRIFAHCLAGGSRGVGLVILNLGTSDQSIPVGNNARTWHVTAAPLDSKFLTINGKSPALGNNGALIGLEAQAVEKNLVVRAQSIAFVAVDGTNNKACS